MLKLYKISRRDTALHDEFDSAIVAAETRRDARHMNPCGDGRGYSDVAWPIDPDDVVVEYLGRASHKIKKPCVILASLNAG